MPIDPSSVPAALVIGACLATMLVPGLLTGVAAGLRGWTLAGCAPLLSYAIAGIAGPWLDAAGIPFNVASFAAATVLFAGIAFGLRFVTVRIGRRKDRAPREAAHWPPAANLAVFGCLVVAAVAGGYTVLHGLGALSAVSQGFDSVYHANGVRYLAETGQADLFSTGQPNWYGDQEVFYPNAYHLLGSIVFRLTGGSIPAVLNANTVLLPGLLALALVALVRAFRGRAVLAGASALIAVVPTMALYESMSRGPLLPFLLGIALTPIGALTLYRCLDRPAPDTAFIALLAQVGLLTVHSSTLFGGILFALPMLVYRWLSTPDEADGRLRRFGRDLAVLLAIAAVSVPVAWLQLTGALKLANSDIPYWGWPNETDPKGAVGTLLLFQHGGMPPQWWLAAALFLGLVFFPRLDRLRWVGGTALLSGALYVLVSTSDTDFVMAISRPWWDDSVRFVAMATIPLMIIAAHGLAETQAVVRNWLAAVPALREHRRRTAITAATVAVVLFAGFAAISGWLYTKPNSRVVAGGYGNLPGVTARDLAVSPGEIAAMHQLATLAKPGEWAMNDRSDGTVWTYAISGVRTVAGHYDPALSPRDATVLGRHFRDYQNNPDVRAAVARLNVRWLILGTHGKHYPTDPAREPGLLDIDKVPGFELVYRNAEAAIYRVPDAAGKPTPAVFAASPRR